MGNPAARVDDLVLHMIATQSVPIITGCASVTINGRLAVRAGDLSQSCIIPLAPPDVILTALAPKIITGSTSVMIGGLPAARAGEQVDFTPAPGTGSVLGPGSPNVSIGG